MPGPGYTLDPPIYMSLREFRKTRHLKLHYNGTGDMYVFLPDLECSQRYMWRLDVQERGGLFIVVHDMGELCACQDQLFEQVRSF